MTLPETGCAAHRISAEDLSLPEKAALLGGANVWQTRGVPRLAVPPLWMSDGPHGLRRQPADADHLGLGESEPAVCFPTAATVANSWDEALAERIGAALGREAAARDVHVLLGPGLNLKRNPLGGRNFEYFSEDPELSGRLAAAYVRGIQSQGVAAAPKHFAVNSQELRRLVSDSVVDERTLREMYLTAFEIVVRESRPWLIMSSYNLVNGVHAHENPHLLLDVLRGEWGFDGVVVSDWGGGHDPAAAVAAGGTIEMPSNGFNSARAIARAVREGTLAGADLDARVNELLTLVQRVTGDRPGGGAGGGSGDHHALARLAAAEGSVLLRNQGGLLPLAPGTRVATVGAFAAAPRYQGAGSSLVNPTRLSTLIGSFAASGLRSAGYAPGFTAGGERTDAMTEQACAVARGADVVVLALAVPASDESEGLDRPHLELPAAQVNTLMAVAATGTPVVVVLAAGGPVETPWLGHTTALLHTYLGGQAGAEAVWDVLTGAVEPGGRLAETMPVRLADDPVSARFPSPGRTAEYRESVFVRYRYHASAGVAPAFPFGFGLGYTTFAYDGLEAGPDGAAFTVTNTGSRAGADVAQLYVRRLTPGVVYRPALELKGFHKVRLAPGERVRVTIPFGGRTFRFFDVRTSTWEVEQGEYRILIGPSSADLPLTATLTVAGTVPAGRPDPLLEPYARADVRHVPDAVFETLLGRPLPERRWQPGRFDQDTPLDQLRHSPGRLARLGFRLLERRKRAADRSSHPDLDTLFVYYAPFRIVHTMTAGAATRAVTDAVLEIARGRGVRGTARVAFAWMAGRRLERRSREEFERLTAPPPGRFTT
ncbi:glycoside hydrolase family 3 C-terminal domain-containing protein [Kineosporia sp. J2-2]|uniref:Glycoside hydrolase family 3 C-terminal domain-containing protein n=1 Tax=Kineosporia corallincola TaxID=2835133 RepID=A0ABS5TPF7_9ACTN|nr:glycoside hydrolase family 3 C-terminal domain-containing protein [Kineosporia corallincola]MBT0771474.1 glycoside hydrolase family 3 C-terminal domain-containing protein [Kineosporia corallincola]